MKLTDYVVHFLTEQGVKHVFGVTGGAAVHLFDSAYRNPKITPVFTHHEQAASFAVEAYSRVNNKMGAGFFTTGPGGTNAITGLCAAWLDSVPCIYISGQTRLEHSTRNKPFRQLGSQQIDIVSVVEPLTKYAVMVEDAKMIKYEMQKAAYIAKTGRPGPVWVDIPLNFQWTFIEPDEIPGFDPSSMKEKTLSESQIEDCIEKCYELIITSKRPMILAGYGIRLGGATEEFKTFIRKTQIPFLSTWNASDILPTDDKLYMGRSGIAGQRGANLAVQNCDLLISIGSHLSIPMTGTNYGAFAREAKIVMVDIDRVELENETVKVHLPIRLDVKVFLEKMMLKWNEHKPKQIAMWHDKCSKYKTYNAPPAEWREQKEFVNPYIFLDTLSDELAGDEVICIDGGGTVLYMSFQGMKIKAGQRLIVSAGIGAMGSAIPESIGACFANDCKRTICLNGDGSMQFNIQELQTILHHNLPIKIFVFNNDGYLAIRHTQDGFLESRYAGSDAKGGLSLPDFKKIASAYGIKSVQINTHQEIKEKLKTVLEDTGPVVCEIMVSNTQQLIPHMGFTQRSDGTYAAKPLEDMEPLLSRAEFLENMIVKPLTEEK
ncbi:MAG: thiamine pyrophosphate-binding protein [Sedimentisphaerales bacterium]|nr:thiamine pyrophosphate-binding protein [Sedimentisphaerales bacterium]